MKPRLVYDEAGEVKPGRLERLAEWWRPAWSLPRIVVGGTVTALGCGMLAASLFWPWLAREIGTGMGWLALGVLLLGLALRSLRTPPPLPESTQYVVHVHKRAWWAAALVLALAGAPGTARADVSFGDVKDAVSEALEPFVDAILDGLCSWLLFPQTDLVTVAPGALPEPMIGNHPDAMPTAPESGLAAAAESIADQQARAANAERLVHLASQAQAAQQAQLTALQTLNVTPAVSVAAGQQIGNEVGIAGAQAAAAAAQMQAASVALQASEIMQREHARQAEIAAYKSWVGYDAIAGGVTIKAD